MGFFRKFNRKNQENVVLISIFQRNREGSTIVNNTFEVKIFKSKGMDVCEWLKGSDEYLAKKKIKDVVKKSCYKSYESQCFNRIDKESFHQMDIVDTFYIFLHNSF